MEPGANTLEIPHDPRIAALLPEAVTYDDKLILPHTLPITKLLRGFNYEVPAPVMSGYDWAGVTPFDVQMKTVAMMTTEPRAYVMNGLGTGKTLCSLFAYDFLRKSGEVNKMLIVGPLSTLWFVWEREVFKWMPHYKTVVLHGSKAKRLKLLEGDWDIAIINHDGVQTVMDQLMKRTDIDCMVLDELSAYRNGQSIRNKSMRPLAARMKFAWGLTATPMPRQVTDVWGLAKVLTPNSVPKYFSHCQAELMLKIGPYKWVPKDGAVEKAFNMLQPSVRYSIDDVVELPEVVMRYVEVPLGEKQKRVYDHMKNKSVAAVDHGEITAQNAGAVMSKLLQAATGWIYDSKKNVHTLDNEERVQTIVDNTIASERKVLIFAPFKSALAGLSEAFTKADIDHATVSGDTPPTIRKTVFHDFQSTDKYKAIVAHPACMSHGLTLTAADTIIWAGPVTDLEIFMQACGRISRIGQAHRQLILMIGGTIVEKRVYLALAKKEQTQMDLLEMIAGAS